MLKYILLATLIFPSTGHAWYLIGSGGGAACSSPSGGDILNEGFEGTGTERTWTGSTGTPNFDQTSWAGTAPTGGCSQFAEFSGTSAVYRTLDLGSARGDTWVRFKFEITAESLDNYQSANILILDNDSDPTNDSQGMTRVFVTQGGDGLLHLNIDSPEGGDLDGGTISLNTTYSVAIQGGSRWSGSQYVQISVASGNTYGTPSGAELAGSNDVRYLHLGITTAPGASVTYHIDAMEIDDDGTF